MAGWVVLGTVVLGLIVSPGPARRLHPAATLLSVSTFAHVLIGVRDVHRIRETDLPPAREVRGPDRLVRHDLRQGSQLLLFAAECLERDDVPDDDVAEGLARDLTAMNDTLARSRELFRGAAPITTIDRRELLVDVVDDSRDGYPDASIELGLPGPCQVRSGDQLRIAVGERRENALKHGAAATQLTVAATSSASGHNITYLLL